MVLGAPAEAQFECQGCGNIIDGHPQDDCEKCGAGHWLHPPSYNVQPKDDE